LDRGNRLINLADLMGNSDLKLNRLICGLQYRNEMRPAVLQISYVDHATPNMVD
jgi:hypothetical protein